MLRVTLFVAGAVTLGVAGSRIYEHRPASRADGDGVVRWLPAWQAEDVAARTGKPLLYDFSADWCEPCQVMQAEVFADPAVADAINAAFVPVRVLDVSPPEPRIRDADERARRRYATDSLPTLAVVDQGRLFRVEGYRGKDATVAFLRGAWRQEAASQP
jgi:thiol:disulfide interchange protein